MLTYLEAMNRLSILLSKYQACVEKIRYFQASKNPKKHSAYLSTLLEKESIEKEMGLISGKEKLETIKEMVKEHLTYHKVEGIN